MPDKDQFTFDDESLPETTPGGQEDLPESDFDPAFSDGEYEGETALQDNLEPPARSGSSSTMRIVLIVLLLVVTCGAGAYYFMDLGGTTLVLSPAQKTKKSVALPPQPAKAPIAPTIAEQAEEPVTPVVSPPVEQATTQVVEPGSEPTSAPEAKSTAIEPAPEPVVAPQIATVVIPPEPKAVTSLKQVAGGAYALDAGSYLLESNRQALETKIRQLGYEPIITPVDATLDMTRLRLGTFGKGEVQEALAFARTIESGSYSTPAGGRYVLYAGTFLKSRYIEKLSQRFLAEGIKAHPEPVQVVRTLSRVRFGSFATREDAAAAAREVGEAGLKAKVTKSR